MPSLSETVFTRKRLSSDKKKNSPDFEFVCNTLYCFDLKPSDSSRSFVFAVRPSSKLTKTSEHMTSKLMVVLLLSVTEKRLFDSGSQRW
jgi:hypothetical protein